MTGMELLKHKLAERYSWGKINANSDFIFAIVAILAEDADLKTKTTIELAEYTINEGNRKWHEAIEKETKADALLVNVNQFEQRLREKERNLKSKEGELSVLEDNLSLCETAEARDRMRLAEYFKNSVDVNTDDLAFIRGMSNILGNGGKHKEINND